MSSRIINLDCREAMAAMDACSVDAVVTDPPYHLTTGKKGGTGEASVNLESPYGRARITTGFMGKAWDGGDIAHSPEVWIAALRVAKPGAYLLAFGGTRTFHRLAVAIEDAGWEIRDCVMWVYGSGFPKSYNGEWGGTALKPAWEPIVMARKPLIGTVAANVQQYGTGGLNVDGCRIPANGDKLGGGDQRPTVKTAAPGWDRPWMQDPEKKAAHAERINAGVEKSEALGRWPANLIHDGSEEVLACFPESAGQLADAKTDGSRKFGNVYSPMKYGRGNEPSADSENDGDVGFKMKPGARRLDTGSAARFFYCAKASREDRNEGLQGMATKPLNWSSGEQSPGTFQASGTDRSSENHHPTVKPTDLMRYLCKLVTPKGGMVLDPFMGSGSTLKAAELEGFSAIGIEIDPEYCEIARNRIASDAPLFAEVIP